MPDYGVNDYKNLLGNINSANTTARNRFDEQMPFDYNAMADMLDKVYGQQSSMLTRNAANTTQRNQRDTVSRLASQGITGGSVLNNQVNKVTDSTNQGFAGALEKLSADRLGQNAGLMQTANQNTYNWTNAAQGADMQNIMAQLQKFGLMGNVTGGLSNAKMQEDQAPGWFEDVLAVLNTGANVAKSFVKPV